MQRACPGLLAALLLSACTTVQPSAGATASPPAPGPSWSAAAFEHQTTDSAWHLAYATQSWAAEYSGHVIVVPARHNFIVDQEWIAADQESHLPPSAGKGPVLKHAWTTHGSSWDYDTDIKFVMFGPGFVKEHVRLGKTTLQNIAPTYAELIGTEPPPGSMGRVMKEALVGGTRRPKVILTIVMDGGGLNLYRAWPDAWPTIASLASRGVEYTEAKVTQLETATAPSHAAIGTGGYPVRTHLLANEVYQPETNDLVSSFDDLSSRLVAAPTLADVYGSRTGHRAVVIGASFSAMPALAMTGHGSSLDPGNKNQIVVFFAKPTKPTWKEQFPGTGDERRLMTNPDLFRFPTYLLGRKPEPYVRELTSGSGTWMGHQVTGELVPFTPAGVRFDCDNVLLMMEHEPIDSAETTALIYVNFKGTDLSSHRWGFESLESREALVAQDKCIGRLLQKLNQRVGEGQYVVTIASDHGMAPLPELVNGHRLDLARLLELINRRFGAEISLGGGFVDLWFDQEKMKNRGITNRDIAGFLRSLSAGDYHGARDRWPAYLPYTPEVKVFFDVFTAEQISQYVKAGDGPQRPNPYTEPEPALGSQ